MNKIPRDRAIEVLRVIVCCESVVIFDPEGRGIILLFNNNYNFNAMEAKTPLGI